MTVDRRKVPFEQYDTLSFVRLCKTRITWSMKSFWSKRRLDRASIFFPKKKQKNILTEKLDKHVLFANYVILM